MGSPTFGMMPGNNAPPPPVFAGNNPTGGAFNFGGTTSKGGMGMPTYPLFGMPSHASPNVSPMANNPVFGAGGMQGLNTGLGASLTGQPGNPGDHLYKELTRAYGKGTGAALFNQLVGGFFNPQVASSFLNAMQPGIARGEQSLLNSFGAEGSRFGSASALGLGDYESQVNLNEQQTLASMYMQAQQEQLSLEGSILPTLHQEEADSGGGFWHDLLGGLEIAGGVALDFVPGMQGIGTALAAGGIGTLSGGGKSPNAAPISIGTIPGSTPPFFPSSSGLTNTQQSEIDFWNQYDMSQLESSGGDALGHLAG